MQNSNINFFCPNCNSTNFVGKTSSGKRYTEGPYKNVETEIQCSDCFMDIPSNLCENILEDDIDKISKTWIEIYKPFHKLDAAKCSKCHRYYWEIEKFLFEKEIATKDIFYQNYNPQKGGGDLICKICDPSAFK